MPGDVGLFYGSVNCRRLCGGKTNGVGGESEEEAVPKEIWGGGGGTRKERKKLLNREEEGRKKKKGIDLRRDCGGDGRRSENCFE